MNNINIDVDSAKVLGEDILSLAKDYSEILEKIRVEIDDIVDSNIWNGNDSSIFINGVNNYLDAFKNVEDTLDFYGHFVNNSSIIYRVLEEDYSTRGIYE